MDDSCYYCGVSIPNEDYANQYKNKTFCCGWHIEKFKESQTVKRK